MSRVAEAGLPTDMTAEQFLAWAETWEDGERYELVEGVPLRLKSERINRAELKASAWLALRDAVRAVGAPCAVFPDGISVRVSARTVREPDAVVHCGPYDGNEVFASNPIVVVEVISPSSLRTDPGRKLLDYFAVPSIHHYLILYGAEERVVHHSRASADGPIATAILGRGDRVELAPPGVSMTVDALFDS